MKTCYSRPSRHAPKTFQTVRARLDFHFKVLVYENPMKQGQLAVRILQQFTLLSSRASSVVLSHYKSGLLHYPNLVMLCPTSRRHVTTLNDVVEGMKLGMTWKQASTSPNKSINFPAAACWNCNRGTKNKCKDGHHYSVVHIVGAGIDIPIHRLSVL